METRDDLNLETALANWRATTALDAQILEELEAHLRDGFAAGLARGLTPTQSFAQALAQLGDLRQLAGEFSKLHQPRRSTAMLSSLLQSPRLRRFARQSAIAIAIALPLRVFVLAPYHAAGASVSPEVPAGSHLLVWRLAPKFVPGDVAAYRDGEKTFLGRVTAVGDSSLSLTRNQKPEFSVPRESVLGRVILTTR